MDKEDFIRESLIVHNGYYDYSKSEYKNKTLKVCIICPEHGEFYQSPSKHLLGQGCPHCRYIKSGKSKSNSIDKFREDFKNVDKTIEADEKSYVNYKNKMRFICHKKDSDGIEHGEFWMPPNNMFNKNNKQSCPKCGREKTIMSKTYSTDKFIKLASKKHNNKYDYVKTDLDDKGENGKVCITCPIHGEFYQTPNNHLYGQGCPICKESTLEKACKTVLLNEGIFFIEQYKASWLGRLSLDFYLPDYGVAIECQGKQHFGIGNWSKDNELIIERDKRKLKLCNENNVRLLYYSNLGIDYPYKVYENFSELLIKIKEK